MAIRPFCGILRVISGSFWMFIRFWQKRVQSVLLTDCPDLFDKRQTFPSNLTSIKTMQPFLFLSSISMRQITFLTLLTLSISTYAQDQKWKLCFQLQPEMTFSKDSYRLLDKNTNKSTFNLGAISSVQYNISDRFFANAGIGFISRTLQSANILNQALLPPPRRSFTKELVITKSVSYRVYSFPLSIGYSFLRKDKFNSFVLASFTGNYLLNTYYNSGFERYNGAYKKKYWQGYSVCFGIGADYKINEKIFATSNLSYSIIHKVKEDEYIRSYNVNGIELSHKFLSLNIGVKLSI